MNIKNLSFWLAMGALVLTGCATPPATAPDAAPGGSPTEALSVLGRNLRAAYPPLQSYFGPLDGLDSLKVFATIDTRGYSCRVFSLIKGKTHTGQVSDSSAFAPPTLTDMHYKKDHDVNVIFSDVRKVQASQSPPPPSVGASFPSFTDVCLLGSNGNTLDTITVNSATASEVTSALLTLCPNAK